MTPQLACALQVHPVFSSLSGVPSQSLSMRLIVPRWTLQTGVPHAPLEGGTVVPQLACVLQVHPVFSSLSGVPSQSLSMKVIDPRWTLHES